jgi:PAS domain S-box-containing protein
MVAERSQRMYSQLLHQSKDAIILHDPDGCIIDVNQRAMELFGHPRSAFVGKDVRELVHPDSAGENEARPRDLLTDGAYHDEVSFVGTSGEVFPAELSATLVDTGTEQVVQAIVRDLSGQRRAQQKLRAMSNRALLYLDILSHDISNQLQVVKSTTELLSLRCDGEIEARLLEDMKGACRKMEGIVTKTKATGQLMVTTLSNRDLIQAVERTTELAKRAFSECSFSISYLVDRAVIKADDLLDHLIFNLLENAFEHNPREDRRVWVTVDSETAGYRLSVADNGPGIPDDVKVSLLQPSRRKGGLGLHMSRHIAEKYGGTLRIENRIEGDVTRGAEVVVGFPAASHPQMLS